MIHNVFSQIISMDNLYQSFLKFKKGKREKLDAQLFERNLEDNLFRLHFELKNKIYAHKHYTSFYINDPKRRHIHKADVRDRIVHHAIYRILYPLFDKSFIFDSYSCRTGKGVHRAVNRLEVFVRKVGKNYSSDCFFLKCDIKKFFASVDHETLKELIFCKVNDGNAMWLVDKVIDSFVSSQKDFSSVDEIIKKAGIPIGNLTSQLFANVYLNELDQFVKHELKVKYYIRYCDDFVIIGHNKEELRKFKNQIEFFLQFKLKLSLHEEKLIIQKLHQGIDFLGYVTLVRHRVLRTKTKKRMIKKVTRKNLLSYLGLLSHCNAYKQKQIIKSMLK